MGSNTSMGLYRPEYTARPEIHIARPSFISTARPKSAKRAYVPDPYKRILEGFISQWRMLRCPGNEDHNTADEATSLPPLGVVEPGTCLTKSRAQRQQQHRRACFVASIDQAKALGHSRLGSFSHHIIFGTDLFLAPIAGNLASNMCLATI